MLENRNQWFDADWWHREIEDIISITDPVRCNLRITQAHYRLSQLLHGITGPDSGANFHTWAVWGSKKAGETIRQEDTRRLRQVTMVASGAAGLGLLALGALKKPSTNSIVWLLGAAATLGAPIVLWRTINRTSREILAGNRTVLEDIGKVTAGFVSVFHDCPQFDIEKIDCFVETLRPGKTESDGQALLARAFLHYYQASFERDIDRKHEQMFLANCYAILHEHIRLEPYIRAAIPLPFRRLITAYMLRFYIGANAFHVRDDVPAERNGIFPETLRELDNAELIAFLHGMEGWDRTPNALESSGATDWSDVKDRMNFIVDLFRSRHLSPSVFARPFTKKQEAELMSGRIPEGPL
jgi:hypothetical protein